jgi:hypothetical protein
MLFDVSSKDKKEREKTRMGDEAGREGVDEDRSEFRTILSKILTR